MTDFLAAHGHVEHAEYVVKVGPHAGIEAIGRVLLRFGFDFWYLGLLRIFLGARWTVRPLG